MEHENKNHKILLVTINSLWRYSNLGLDQIAGYLRNKNYDVDMLYHHEKVDIKKIISKLDYKYDIYGFSVNSANYEWCVEMASYIKTQNNNAVIVFGGGYPTRYYKEIFNKNRDIDFIILGDGELPFENLLKYIAKEEDIRFIPNIATSDDMEDKVPYCNGKIDYFPAFDYFENDTLLRNKRKEYCLQTKNNICTGKCSFCTERRGTVSYKDISHIIKEIKYVHINYGVKKFFFTDDNILDPHDITAKRRIIQLCKEIEKLNLNLVFKCYIRANSLKDSPEDNALLATMSNAGFKTFFVGIEAGNMHDLKTYNKFTTVEDNYKILELLQNHYIAPQIGFININPYSTLETLKQNYYFLVNIEMDNLFMYVCSYLRVYKYTAIYEQMKKDKLLMERCDYLDDKSLYYFADDEVQKIFDFIQKRMLNRIRDLDYEFDWLYSFYVECKKINPVAVKYEEEVLFLKKIQLDKIKEFFYVLFVENDLVKAENQVEEFLNFFEEAQPAFANIHRELLGLYLK